MEREWLHEQLAQGKSFAEIARLAACDGSTVARWAKRYGLRSSGAEKFTARGAPDRLVLETMAAEGPTLSEIAVAVDRSPATVRYWLAKWEIERVDARLTKLDAATAPREVERLCSSHGLTAFVLEGRGYYRCKRCRQERVSEWRRRVKRRLVEEAGGRCALCGYDRCVAALQFHHRDAARKSFALSREGVTRSFAEARAEAAKCVLLCANCHAEVEAGQTEIDPLAA
ncbi:MAG TPA: hypothetical protein VGF21_14605 [Thermoleophilaceae bacterium]